MSEENLSGQLMIEVFCLLVHYDEYARMVRSLVPVELYEGPLDRKLINYIYGFIDKFGAAPKYHLSDLLEHELQGDDKELYQTIIERIDSYRAQINPQYVVDRVHKFIRMQSMRKGVYEAYEALERGDLDGAETIFQTTTRTYHATFDMGTVLADTKELTSIWEEPVLEFPSGITGLDRVHAVPFRGGTHTFLALSNRGKSWWAIHMGVESAKHGHKVLHVSLEMGKPKVLGRYLQTGFAIPRERMMGIKVPVIKDAGFGYELQRFSYDRTMDVLSKPNVILEKVAATDWMKNIRVAKFPMRSIGIRELEGFLDLLEQSEGWMPDLLIVDYPDIMKLPAHDLRIATGHLYADLRGLGEKRNMALLLPNQSNRDGTRRTWIEEDNTSEDFSKIMSADISVSYSQTDEEYRNGIARLYVIKNRDNTAKSRIVITQNYAIGQFCLSDVVYRNEPYRSLSEEIEGAPDEIHGTPITEVRGMEGAK